MAEPTSSMPAHPAAEPGSAQPRHSPTEPVNLDPAHRVELYGDSLWRYAMAKSRDPQAAEDLVKDTLTTALTAAARFEGRSAELIWLTGILKHKLMKHFRKVRRQPEQSEDDNPDSRTADAAAKDGVLRAQTRLMDGQPVTLEKRWPDVIDAIKAGQVVPEGGNPVKAAAR